MALYVYKAGDTALLSCIENDFSLQPMHFKGLFMEPAGIIPGFQNRIVKRVGATK
jgi:hypothetical protein